MIGELIYRLREIDAINWRHASVPHQMRQVGTSQIELIKSSDQAFGEHTDMLTKATLFELEELLNLSENAPKYGHEGEDGVDALAWYVSFHASQSWGVYVPESGLARFAKKFIRRGVPHGISFERAWSALMSHEFVHFGVDIAIAHIELLQKKAVWENPTLWTAFPNSNHKEIEEQLANGAKLLDAYRYRKRGGECADEVLEILLDFVRSQPAGYRDGEKSRTPHSFLQTANQYLEDLVIHGAPDISGSRSYNFNLGQLIPYQVSWGSLKIGCVNGADCPIYLIRDITGSIAQSGLTLFITAVKDIRESEKFRKSLKREYFQLWRKTRSQLGDPNYPKNTGNLKLERWTSLDEPGVKGWSVRVGGQRSNIRAHLIYDLRSGEWVAKEIGDADSLGHHKQL